MIFFSFKDDSQQRLIGHALSRNANRPAPRILYKKVTAVLHCEIYSQRITAEAYFKVKRSNYEGTKNYYYQFL